MTQEPIVLVTRKGECFEAAFQRTSDPNTSDTRNYLFHITDRRFGRGQRLVSVVTSLLPMTTDYLRRHGITIDDVVLNTLRAALDSGQLSFDDTPVDSSTYKKLHLNSIEDTAVGDDDDIREFVTHKAFWAGYRFNLNPASRFPVSVVDPIDLQYLNASNETVVRNIWYLSEQGTVDRTKIPGLIFPTMQLVKQYEAGLKSQTAQRRHKQRDNFLEGVYESTDGREELSMTPMQVRKMADRLGISESDTGEALKYWLSEGILERKPAGEAIALTHKGVQKHEEAVRRTMLVPSSDDTTETNSNSRRVFIVHGHDEALKQSVARFLEHLDLEPIILHEKPNRGRTIIEKFEDHADVGFAVVLLTGDDLGGLDADHLQRRARQNVLLELGYFIGKLGRSHVCALYVSGIELPSDINGVLYVQVDAGEKWKMELAKELRAAGINVDFNKIQ